MGLGIQAGAVPPSSVGPVSNTVVVIWGLFAHQAAKDASVHLAHVFQKLVIDHGKDHGFSTTKNVEDRSQRYQYAQRVQKRHRNQLKALEVRTRMPGGFPCPFRFSFHA
ncbi:uncharacterized protein N7483_007468 [Penicillium malachiteum]|uniref:uncharacterized protein n=1 Tax=Penicillium malachiteum TaxID=1324776 RepID=UPI002548CBB3|nr:uncharacterized protein N7483_007468 [Penicillium malachiteum]KAJ5726111.1 hypothetical protein N7483_007468 [Penicillium malachiteum]